MSHDSCCSFACVCTSTTRGLLLLGIPFSGDFLWEHYFYLHLDLPGNQYKSGNPNKLTCENLVVVFPSLLRGFGSPELFLVWQGLMPFGTILLQYFTNNEDSSYLYSTLFLIPFVFSFFRMYSVTFLCPVLQNITSYKITDLSSSYSKNCCW